MNIGHYIYICECADGTWYTGWSTDPEERIRTHNRGRGAKYTRSRLPVRLVYTEGFASKKEAMRREYDIKQMTRKQKEELVEGGRNRMGKIYYLMGKSATGKDHIYERLLSDDRLRQLDLKPLVIYTTRPMRDGEEDGVTYHFTDEAGLRRMEEQGKVIEKRCYETIRGPWYYYTADDGSIDLARHNYLAIGTPAAYKKIRKHFGAGRVQALYVETEDGLRLERALKRERKQEVPQYKEMCRRFLADEKDFAPVKLKSAGISRIFKNNGTLDECLEEIVDFLLS